MIMQALIACDTVAPRTWWSTALICAAFRSCSAMPTFPRRRFIRTWPWDGSRLFTAHSIRALRGSNLRPRLLLILIRNHTGVFTWFLTRKRAWIHHEQLRRRCDFHACAFADARLSACIGERARIIGTHPARLHAGAERVCRIYL